MNRNMVRVFFAALAFSIALPAGVGLAQGQPTNCVPAGAPAKLEGHVQKIDHNKGTVTIKDSSGATYDFQANAETLRSYKVGDRIAAALRPGQECKKS